MMIRGYRSMVAPGMGFAGSWPAPGRTRFRMWVMDMVQLRASTATSGSVDRLVNESGLSFLRMRDARYCPAGAC
jgi:hypothetical protein